MKLSSGTSSQHRLALSPPSFGFGTDLDPESEAPPLRVSAMAADAEP
jgi:hypothetical protein